jgi:hypothetical protein
MQSRRKRGQKHTERMDNGGANAAAVVGKPPSILNSSKSTKRKLPIEPPAGDKAGGMTAQDTPTQVISKFAHPQGSSPMARDSNDLDLTDLDLNLGDNNDDEAFKAKEDTDSISRMNSSTGKELFKASGGEAAQGNQDGGNVATASMQGKRKSWKPIAKQAAAVAAGQGSG